jgi:protoporphyrinogen oxidase
MSDSVVVIGSGMAALGAHEVLHDAGVDHVLYDKNGHPGGHTATFRDPSGFIFDDGPHISFTEDARLQELLAKNVGGHFETIKCYVDNYWHGHWVKHPAQINLHGLPTDLIVECVRDFITAANAAPDGVDAAEIANYEQWLRASFGDTFAETFPMVYGRKYHTVDAGNMSTDWLGPRLYTPDLEEVLRGAIDASTPDVHYVDHFRYPAAGGFISYLEPWLSRAELHLGSEVTGIDAAERVVRFADGTARGYLNLVSSMPLPELIPLIDGAPSDVVQASAKLACTQAVIINVGVGRDDISPAQWRYFYDEDLVFTRCSFPHLLSPSTCPPGSGSVQVECYYSDKYRPLDRTPASCIEPVIADLIRTGIFDESDEIVFAEARPIKYANVIFDLDRALALETVHGYLRDVDLHWCGRYGDWDYSWTDQAFFSGEAAAEAVLSGTHR